MMARNHCLVGAGGWLAVATVARVEPSTAFAGAAVCAGAALIPDLDHPRSTIAHSLGPLTRWVAGGVERISGGHRHATHSFLFAAAAGSTVVIAESVWGRNATLVVAFLCAALAAKALVRGAHPFAVAGVAGAAAWWLTQVIPVGSPYLGLVVATGCVLHLVGDSVTHGAFPWLWPFRWRWSADLIDTNGLGEHVISFGLVVAVVVLGYRMVV